MSFLWGCVVLFLWCVFDLCVFFFLFCWFGWFNIIILFGFDMMGEIWKCFWVGVWCFDCRVSVDFGVWFFVYGGGGWLLFIVFLYVGGGFGDCCWLVMINIFSFW